MKILYITSNNPLLSHDGSHQRTKLIYDSLRKISIVDVLLVRRENIAQDDTSIIDNLIGDIRFNQNNKKIIPYSKDLELSKWAKNNIPRNTYDKIISRRLMPICKINGFNFGEVILDYDDPEHLYSNVEVTNKQEKLLKRIITRFRKYIKTKIILNHLSKCSHIWYISNKDMNRTSTNTSSSILPNIPFGKEHANIKTPSSTKIIMTVGLMTYEPNIRGVNHFLKNVWPYIKEAEPEAIFRIVGKYHKSDYEKWKKIKGVEILGFVESLDLVYSQCQFTVAPIYFGGGTNIKVLESLSKCKTCVVTPFSQYGFEQDFLHGKSIYLANKDADMIIGCIELLRNYDKCISMGQLGREIVHKNYSYKSFQAIIKSSITANTS